MMDTALTFKILSELPPEIDDEGTMWYRNELGELHRDNGQPAVISAAGEKRWYKDGNLHRDNDQPAIIYADGTKEWWVNGKFIK